jgi:transcriptional regulator with XRE-family HTH domain
VVPNARQIGRSLRAVRRRLRLRQADVAARTGVSQTFVSRVERGELRGVPVEELVSLFDAVGARLELRPAWNGAALDRLLDERHAELVELAINVLQRAGWDARSEVTFAVYGERGSYDVLAWHAGTRTLLVVEVKTEFGSLEATLRTLDVKSRLARRIAAERSGWSATNVGRLLVVVDSPANRRHAAARAAVLRPFPTTSGWHVRGWLRAPEGDFSALWFASPSRRMTATRTSSGPRRVRATAGTRPEHEPTAAPAGTGVRRRPSAL